MKVIISILIFVSLAFSASENISLVNNVKNIIQKEEYLALAINKYILQTGSIPKKSDDTLDWTKLETQEYLGTNFNKTNPFTSENISVIFVNNNAFIQSIIEETSKFDPEYNYLYNFYVNKVFRVNTIPPINTSKEKLVLGSQVLYDDLQKEITTLLNKTNPEDIKLSNQDCVANEYYYELGNEKLTYKYCKSDGTKLEVFQKEPIYAEDEDNLQYIIAEIGAKAYYKKGAPVSSWYETYFVGINDSDGSSIWSGSTTTTPSDEPVEIGEGKNIQDILLSYIPNSKDLMLRRDGGCMLANGDIFCWGNNQYKKVGIENYGQLDTKLKPYYVNTPVMLKVQIDTTAKDETNKAIKDENANRETIKWYNNPYRTKFQKMAMNSLNVCAVSPIFVSSTTKTGGDLYCNGKISASAYENMSVTSSESGILKRNIFIANKTNGIYLNDVAMVEDVIAVLSDDGKIYTMGRNYMGALGIDSSDKFIIQFTPIQVANSGQKFKKIFALRDIKTFGAIDENNEFYIWGERPNGMVYYKPTLIAGGQKFNPDAIFTNSKEFLLKGTDGTFYRTNNDLSVTSVNSNIPSNAISASIYDHSDGSTSYIYATNKMELMGSTSFLSCKETGGNNCNTTDSAIFSTALTQLNTISEDIGYANFANISIYQLDTVKQEFFEDFEDGLSTDWDGSSVNKENKKIRVTSVSNDGTDQIPVTKFLGNFQAEEVSYNSQPSTNYVNKPSYIEKTFTFNSAYANSEVELEFDFYEIDTWDFERFTLTLNGEVFVEDNFIHDDHEYLTDINDTGEALQKVASSGSVNNDNDERYHYKIRTKLDSNAKIKVRFSTRGLKTTDNGYNGWSFAQSRSDESWGIDNVHVKAKETSKTFVCAMTGVDTASQMYCWGNVGRSIPILSTSLYDVSKINTINKLFVSQESDKTTQMSFDKYNNSGNLFLKYPTYIGGFDYPFYFK